MKRVLSILILLLILCTSVFADDRFTVTFDPFTLQRFVQKSGDSATLLNSEIGIGIGIGYDRAFCNDFRYGADLKADFYINKDTFTDVSLLAKVGYLTSASDSVILFANAKAGLDLQICNKKAGAVFEFGPEIGTQFKLDDHFDLFASCEILFGFPRKDDVKYSEFRVTTAIGAGYTF